MFTNEKLKKLHRILTSKISKTSKKLSLNMKINKVRENTYNKKNIINSKNSKINNKNKSNNSNKRNENKSKKVTDKTFQNNLSILSEIKQKNENFNESFASYLTDNNFLHKNIIKKVKVIKNTKKELYDKSLLYHIMKYFITKSQNNSIRIEHLYYMFNPIENYINNSKIISSKNNSNEKRKYINYDENFNLTFGKKANNIENSDRKNKNINNENQINNMNLMNNQIFNNNFIFNINNYKSNIKISKLNEFKDIINEEDTPSFHKENKDDKKKYSNHKNQQKKRNLTKNYINIEELKLNNHILQNLIHKKKAMDNSKNKLTEKIKNKNSQTPRIKSLNKKINLINEINNRAKNKYNKSKDNKNK